MLNLRLLSVLGIVTLLLAVNLWPAGQRKDKDDQEEITQTLEIPKDPPSVAIGETQRLVFHVTALSSKGLLSRQMSDALKNLRSQLRGATPVKLRAFVAGSGDVRRVQAIVSETFSDKRLPLPAVTVVQVGALPMVGAQVILESVSTAKKPVNPHGLAFISGQLATTDDPLAPAAPLVEKSLGHLKTAVSASRARPEDVLRVTCFLSTLQDVNTIRSRVYASFPKAAVNFVQTQRSPYRGLAECEAVARLAAPPEKPVHLLNPAGLEQSANYSQVALVNVPRLAFSGMQLAFRAQDDDVRLAFQRLGSTLEGVKTGYGNLAMATYYPLSSSIMEKIRALRFEFLDKSKPPASTMLVFEGLPSLDTSFGLDVIAAIP